MTTLSYILIHVILVFVKGGSKTTSFTSNFHCVNAHNVRFACIRNEEQYSTFFFISCFIIQLLNYIYCDPL